MAGPDCLSRLLQESWKHYRNNDNEWTTVDFYDEVPAFKQLFEKLESDDRDFLTPKVDTETVSVYQKGGGKKVSSETSAIFEIQQDLRAKGQQSFFHERPQLVESLWDPVRKEDLPPGPLYDHAAERQNAYKYQHATSQSWMRKASHITDKKEALPKYLVSRTHMLFSAVLRFVPIAHISPDPLCSARLQNPDVRI
jgi:hypothetical protein